MAALRPMQCNGGGGGVAAHMSVDLPAGMHAWTSAAASPCIHASILLNHPWCLPVQVKGQCGGTGQPAAAACSVDSCSPYITRSPCANDTATSCALKTCPGKYMYFNAILPQVSNRVQRACMHAAPRMIRAWPPVHAYMCKLRENPPAHACLVPMQHGRDGDGMPQQSLGQSLPCVGDSAPLSQSLLRMPACLDLQETCYELYTYQTSGLPVNCYGQRYINNRIAQLAAAQAQREAMANATAADSAKGKGAAADSSRGGPPNGNGKKDAPKPDDGDGAAGAEDAKVASKPADAGTGSQATTVKDSASSSKDSAAGAGASKGKGGKKAADSSKQKKSG